MTVPILHVCTTCRAGIELAPGETPAGQFFHDAVAGRLAAAGDGVAELRPVVCLSVCKRGCTVAISMQGKWTYLLANLDIGKADDLLVYAQAYAASKTGAVLKSGRPASLADAVVGRVPSLDRSAG